MTLLRTAFISLLCKSANGLRGDVKEELREPRRDCRASGRREESERERKIGETE